MCALMGSFLAKTYDLTNMAEKPHFRSISLFFSKFGPNLFINGTSCHSFVFARQNIGVVHHIYDVCHDGSLRCKNMWPLEHGRKQLNGPISDF